jgi:hypothetical protein
MRGTTAGSDGRWFLSGGTKKRAGRLSVGTYAVYVAKFATRKFQAGSGIRRGRSGQQRGRRYLVNLPERVGGHQRRSGPSGARFLRSSAARRQVEKLPTSPDHRPRIRPVSPAANQQVDKLTTSPLPPGRRGNNVATEPAYVPWVSPGLRRIPPRNPPPSPLLTRAVPQRDDAPDVRSANVPEVSLWRNPQAARRHGSRVDQPARTRGLRQARRLPRRSHWQPVAERLPRA